MNKSRNGSADVMGFGAMEIVGKYLAHWRASTHLTALSAFSLKLPSPGEESPLKFSQPGRVG